MRRNTIIIAIIIAVLSLLLMTACDTTAAPYSESTTEKPDFEQVYEPTDEPAGNDVSAEGKSFEQPRSGRFFQRGVWQDGIFTSEYLGLKFLLPDGWHIASDSDIADVMGVSIDLIEQAAELDLVELMDVAAIDAIYDMMASSLAGANVIITYERLVFPFTRISEIEYMEAAANMMVEMGFAVHFDYPGTTRFGNYDWYSFGHSIVL